MKKRLRKKKHLGEFRQYGFEVHFRYRVEDIDAFVDEYIDFVESRNLCSGGGFDFKDAEQYVTKYRGSCTKEDQDAVRIWLEKHPAVTLVDVRNLTDAWHEW